MHCPPYKNTETKISDDQAGEKSAQEPLHRRTEFHLKPRQIIHASPESFPDPESQRQGAGEAGLEVEQSDPFRRDGDTHHRLNLGP